MMPVSHAIQQTRDFFRDVNKYNINTDYSELEFRKGNDNYNRIIDLLKQVSLPEPTTLYESLSLFDFKNYIKNILIKIFGPNFEEEIDSLLSMFEVHASNEPMDTVVQHALVNETLMPEKIIVSGQFYTMQIPSVCHSITSAMMLKYNTGQFSSIIGNYHYKDLLPTLISYIACYELSLMLKVEQLEDNYSVIRTNFVKELISEDQQAASVKHLFPQKYGKLSKTEKDAIVQKVLGYPEMTYDDFVNYLEYQRHNMYGILISEIYSSYLTEIYKSSGSEVSKHVASILKGEASILNLINVYNVSLSSKSITNTYLNKVQGLSLKLK